jgi:hypothetical protein
MGLFSFGENRNPGVRLARSYGAARLEAACRREGDGGGADRSDRKNYYGER